MHCSHVAWGPFSHVVNFIISHLSPLPIPKFCYNGDATWEIVLSAQSDQSLRCLQKLCYTWLSKMCPWKILKRGGASLCMGRKFFPFREDPFFSKDLVCRKADRKLKASPPPPDPPPPLRPLIKITGNVPIVPGQYSISRVERKTIVTQTYFWNPCLGATWTPL